MKRSAVIMMETTTCCGNCTFNCPKKELREYILTAGTNEDGTMADAGFKHLCTTYTKTLKYFKEFMTSDAVPNYVRRYSCTLSKEEWKFFYGQMKIALDLTEEPEYLFYVLKWILKNEYDDIAYEMYCQDMSNPEGRSQNLIKPSKWADCAGKYHEMFMRDYALTEDREFDCAIIEDNDADDAIVNDYGIDWSERELPW